MLVSDQMVGLIQCQGCPHELCALPLIGEVTDQDLVCVEESDIHFDEMGPCEARWDLDSGTGNGSEAIQESKSSEPHVDGDVAGEHGGQDWEPGVEMVGCSMSGSCGCQGGLGSGCQEFCPVVLVGLLGQVVQ